tara:strand:+ start:324 stop:443 length:120 start_codon:yes stop_codon:yes gene_type:complete
MTKEELEKAKPTKEELAKIKRSEDIIKDNNYLSNLFFGG